MKKDLLGKALSELEEQKKTEQYKAAVDEEKRRKENYKELANKLESYQCELNKIVGENIDEVLKYVIEHACIYYNMVSEGLFKKKYRVAVLYGRFTRPDEIRSSVVFTDGSSIFVERHDFSGKGYVFSDPEKTLKDRNLGPRYSNYKKIDEEEKTNYVTDWVAGVVCQQLIGEKYLTIKGTINMLNDEKSYAYLRSYGDPATDSYYVSPQMMGINKYLKKTPEERVKEWISAIISNIAQ